MGWCIECHNKAEIDLASSGYYEEIHHRLKDNLRGNEELRKYMEDGQNHRKGAWRLGVCQVPLLTSIYPEPPVSQPHGKHKALLVRTGRASRDGGISRRFKDKNSLKRKRWTNSLTDERLESTHTGRRDFLKFMGFGLTAATLAACETPVVKSIPYTNKPEEVTPGVANFYASTYYDGQDFVNVLVKTREGRPIFVKSNPKQDTVVSTLVSMLLYCHCMMKHASTDLESAENPVTGRKSILLYPM